MLNDDPNKRKAEKLQDAIGLVDDKFVEEAVSSDEADIYGGASVIDFDQAKQARQREKEEQADGAAAPSAKRKRKKPIIIGGSIAAALALTAVVGTTLMKTPEPDTTSKTDSAYTVDSTKSSDSHSHSGGGSGIGWDPSEVFSSSGMDGVSDVSSSDSDPLGSFLNGLGSAMSNSDSESATAERSIAPTSSDAETATAWNDQVIDTADAFMLTAGMWNDNENWPFFENLINSNKISFPAYGIDPRHRVKVTVENHSGEKLRGKTVELYTENNKTWKAVTGKDGNAYLFYDDGDAPKEVSCEGSSSSIGKQDTSRQQGGTSTNGNEITLKVGGGSKAMRGIQVSFILDTTGSMSDELLYLQHDFASIARDAGGDNVFYSANFYRDEGDDYVVKKNGFTSNVEEVSRQLMAEAADGGGDMPEAVSQALKECITDNAQWDDNYAHVAFLIFDAPPHYGKEGDLRAAVAHAAEHGIKLVPVVASNADRDTELFGRAIAAKTGAPYVFLTDDSGIGDSHLEPIIGDYTVEKLHDVIVRIIQEEK